MTPTTPTDAQMKLADVTQADRDAAAWALDLAPNSQTWETLTAAHRTPNQIWQANRVAQAFAHHRLATEARAQGLVDAERERCIEIAKNELIKCKKRTWGWYICWRIHEAIRSQHSQHGGERER